MAQPVAGITIAALFMNEMGNCVKCALTWLARPCQWCSILTPELKESPHRSDQYSQHTLQPRIAFLFLASEVVLKGQLLIWQDLAGCAFKCAISD